MPRLQRGTLRKERRRSGGDTWVLRFRVTKPDGQRAENTHVIGFVRDFPSESSAWDEVERRHLNQQINKPAFKARITFADLANSYEQHELEDQSDVCRPKSHTTITRYKCILRNYLVPRWGKNAALSIEPLEVEKWFSALKKRPLANTTLYKVRQVMALVFKHGQRFGLLPRREDANPVRFVRCQSTSDYESMTVTPEQALAITRELPELEKTLVVLTAATGLRISEGLGLQWADVDFVHHQIYIRRSWAAGELGKTKTKASKAVVPMHKILAGFMQSWKEQTRYSKETDWVFPSFKLEGKQPRVQGMLITDYLRPAAARAGILSSRIETVDGRQTMVITDERTFGFHALRHSLATFLVSKDVDPKTVQGILRHANVTTTLQLYAKSVDDKRLKAQGRVLTAMLKPAAGSSRHVHEVA